MKMCIRDSCKCIELDSLKGQPFDGMGDLKVVVVVVGGVKGLVKGVVGDGMEHFVVDPAAVFPVNDFAHEPESLLHGGGGFAQLFHKIKIQIAGAVQAQTVDVERVHPEDVYKRQVQVSFFRRVNRNNI